MYNFNYATYFCCCLRSRYKNAFTYTCTDSWDFKVFSTFVCFFRHFSCIISCTMGQIIYQNLFFSCFLVFSRILAVLPDIHIYIHSKNYVNSNWIVTKPNNLLILQPKISWTFLLKIYFPVNFYCESCPLLIFAKKKKKNSNLYPYPSK